MSTYTQSDLVDELVGIFPEFRARWEKDTEDDAFSCSSLHGVYQSLLPFVATQQPTQRQWQRLADHLSAAVDAGGDRENAADTCMLEHLHQVKLNRVLRPLLNNTARAYVRR